MYAKVLAVYLQAVAPFNRCHGGSLGAAEYRGAIFPCPMPCTNQFSYGICRNRRQGEGSADPGFRFFGADIYLQGADIDLQGAEIDILHPEG